MSALPVPGLFELLEASELGDTAPDPGAIGLPVSARAAGGEKMSSTMWRSLRDRLAGYRPGEVLLDREPVWIELVELWVPPAGRATFVYERESTKEVNLDVKVLGLGFGSGTSLSFDRSITLTASASGKALRLPMLLTARRYENKAGSVLVRVDVAPPEIPAPKVADLSAPADDIDDPLKWRIVERPSLSSSAEAGAATLTYSSKREARWEVRLGIALPAPLELTPLRVEATGVETATVTLELPYGKDYVLYVPAGQSPLAPRIAVAR